MPIVWTARINPGTGIVLISTNCFWIHLRTAICGCPIGILARHGDTIRRRQTRPGCSTVDDAGAMPKCVFTHEHFRLEDDRPPRHPWSKTVIYETHVRGFTIHPNSGVKHPGTYRGSDGKDPLFQRTGGDGRGTDART